jgi:opacity protein-like surface antigen
MSRHCHSIFIGLFLSVSLYGQDYKGSFSLSYPITIDQNFIGENYVGFLDVGLSYHCVNYQYISIGASFDASIFSNNDNLDLSSLDSYKAIAYILEPKINIVGTIPSLEMIHPFVGLGYSFLLFDISGVNPGLGIIEDGETLYGFSFNTGLKTDVSKRVFVILEYDFTRVERDGLVPNTRYNKNVNFIKLGVGFRF